MCTVISWKGKMAKGLISRLLLEAESRGKDSTGLAYRAESGTNTTVFRHAISAKNFIKRNAKNCGEARRSKVGIAHTRRASKGMPINNRNAHPFIYGKYVYAHNGKIDNWEQLKEAGKQVDASYFNDNITTDSQVLGHYIETRDFTPVKGCMGLVWLKGDNAYCFRSAKELACAVVQWKSTKEADQSGTITLVASTTKIVTAALEKTPDIEFTVQFVDILENHVYQLNENGLEDEGEVPVNHENHVDIFTSEEVTNGEAPLQIAVD